MINLAVKSLMKRLNNIIGSPNIILITDFKKIKTFIIPPIF